MSRVCPACSTSYSSEVSFCGHDGRITIQVQPPGEEDPRLGTQLGDFVVAARVADGAMGRVYEGRHPETRQQVAERCGTAWGVSGQTEWNLRSMFVVNDSQVRER